MKIRYKSKAVRVVVKVLMREGFYIQRVKGSHICMNRKPPMRRPLVVPNHKNLSPGVRNNILNLAYEEDLSEKGLKEIYEVLKRDS